MKNLMLALCEALIIAVVACGSGCDEIGADNSCTGLDPKRCKADGIEIIQICTEIGRAHV